MVALGGTSPANSPPTKSAVCGLNLPTFPLSVQQVPMASSLSRTLRTSRSTVPRIGHLTTPSPSSWSSLPVVSRSHQRRGVTGSAPLGAVKDFAAVSDTLQRTWSQIELTDPLTRVQALLHGSPSAQEEGAVAAGQHSKMVGRGVSATAGHGL